MLVSQPVTSLKTPSVFDEAARLEVEGEPFVLCTVAGAIRSTPRDSGARMLVRSGGAIVGTIGGGPLEATVIREAIELIGRPEAEPVLFDATLSDTGEVNLGMKCGGEIQVLLDPVRPRERLVVFGAGHVGLKIADLALASEWRVTVADDRPERLALVSEGASRVSFEADTPERALAIVGPGDFVVIVTRCHEMDERVLRAALPTKARYIGCIGSRRKIAVVFRNIRHDAGLDPSRDPRVYSPVGLDLGSKRPGEIAVSVMAELLAVRDGRAAHHRRLPPRPEAAGEPGEGELDPATAASAARSR